MDVLEVVELEERMHDEVLCDHTHAATSCSILATHRFRKTCPQRPFSMNVCRMVATVVKATADALCCGGCGRPVGVCWVVTAL